MLKRNMKIKKFLDEYRTHDPRMYDIDFNPIDKTLSMKLENVEWVQLKYEEEGRFFTRLDLKFNEVSNLKVGHSKRCDSQTENSIELNTRRLANLDESILGIYLDGSYTVTIIMDPSGHESSEETLILFSAKSVDVSEIQDIKRRCEIVTKHNK